MTPIYVSLLNVQCTYIIYIYVSWNQRLPLTFNLSTSFHHRNVGDVIFDVVKEVVAELVGSMLSRSFGIGTAR